MLKTISLVLFCFFFGGVMKAQSAAVSSPVANAAEIPSDVRELGQNAEIARSRGDLPTAVELYRQALRSDPGWTDGWFLLGQLEYATDQYEQARTSLTRYIERSPKATAALALRALCEFETHSFDISLDDLQRAIAMGAANQPRNGQILLYHEALLLTRLGRFDEAIARYTAFVRQGIVNADVESGIALAGLHMPLMPQEIDPRDVALVQITGQAAVLALTGDPTAARAAFRDVLKQFPGRPYVHYFCGYLLFTTSPDQAVDEFRAELDITPNSPLAHAMLAWAAELRGDYAAALPDAEAAVTQDPGLPMSQLVLGRALTETEDVNSALPHLDQVVQAQPENLEAHLSLVKAYSKLGRKEDAHRERLLCLQLSGEGTAANANR